MKTQTATVLGRYAGVGGLTMRATTINRSRPAAHRLGAIIIRTTSGGVG